MKTMIEASNLGDANNPHMVCVLPEVKLADRYVVEGARSAEGKINGTVHVCLALGKEVVRKPDGKGKLKPIGYKRAAKVSTKLKFVDVLAEDVLKIVSQQLTTKFNIDEAIEDEYDVNELIAPKARTGGGAKPKQLDLAATIAAMTAEGKTPEQIQAWMLGELAKVTAA